MQVAEQRLCYPLPPATAGLTPVPRSMAAAVVGASEVVAEHRRVHHCWIHAEDMVGREAEVWCCIVVADPTGSAGAADVGLV